MGYIIAAFCFFCAAVNYLATKKWHAPIVFFMSLWGVISLLAALKLFDLYEVSIRTWLLFLLGFVAFLLGCYFAKVLRARPVANRGDRVLFSVRYSVFHVAIVIVVLVYLVYSWDALKLYLQGYGMDEVRLIYYDLQSVNGGASHGALMEIFRQYIVTPFELIVTPLCIVEYMQNNRKRYLLCSVLLVLLNVVATGSRFVIAYYIIQLAIAFVVYKKRIVMSRRMKRFVKLLLALTAAGIVLVTFLRAGTVENIVKKYYRYICGCIPYLDNRLGYIDSLGFFSAGIASFFGFVQPIWFVLQNLGIFGYSARYLQIIDTVLDTQVFVKIGWDTYTNAFVTPIYHLYADLGLIGIILGMMLFGMIAYGAYNGLERRFDVKSVTFYLIIARMLFKSIQFYPLTSVEFALGLVFFGFFFAKQKNSPKGGNGIEENG
ncbi:MAG: oligosaccharide repeat unit polymerase [Ruminococcaceae bacterium]|nr:oligosaccharide repeat unit polymerase [Oscillospiraceae bacterium]